MKDLIIMKNILLLLLICLGTLLQAQDFIQLQNRLQSNGTEQTMHLETEDIDVGAVQPGWWSKDWIIEAADGGTVRIKNRYRGTYLHMQDKVLEAGKIEPGWWSAMWRLESTGDGYYRIVNRWLNSAILVTDGKLQSSGVSPDQQSAHWQLIGYGSVPSPTTPPSEPGNNEVSSTLQRLVSEIGKHMNGGSTSANSDNLSVNNLTLRAFTDVLSREVEGTAAIISNIPDFLLDEVKLVQAQMTLSAGLHKEARLSLTTALGDLTSQSEFTIQQTSSGKAAIIFGIALPGLEQIAQLAGISIDKANGGKNAQEIQKIQEYFAFNTAAVFATNNVSKNFKSSLPGLKNYTITEGMTLRGEAVAKWPAINAAIQDEDTRKILNSLFTEESFVAFTGTVKPNSGSAILKLEFNPNLTIISPVSPYQKIITLNGFSMGVNLQSTSTSFSADGTITAHINNQEGGVTNLQFSSGFLIDAINSSIGLRATFNASNSTGGDQGWRNPLGMPGISIAELGIDGNLEAVIPWVSGGVYGEATLGFTPRDLELLGMQHKQPVPLRGAMALKVDINTPQNSLINLSFSSLKVTGLLDAYPLLDLPKSSPFYQGLNSGLKKVEMYFSPIDQKIAGKDYKMGLKVKGDAEVFGWSGALDIDVRPTSNFYFGFTGRMDPLKASFDIKGTNVDIFELKGLRSGEPAILDVKGSLNAFPTANAKVNFSFLRIGNNPALFTGTGDINFDQTNMHLRGDANLFGQYKGQIDLSATNYANFNSASYSASGSFKNPADFQERLTREIMANAKKGLLDAEIAKASVDPGKPFLGAIMAIYVEGKKTETSFAEALSEVLTNGFILEEVSFAGNASPQAGSFTGTIRGKIGGKSFNESITLAATAMDLNKFAEEAALAILGPLLPAPSPGQENDYQVEIDACHSAVTHTGTKNNIIVQFWSGTTLAGVKIEVGPGERCTFIESNVRFDLRTAMPITHVVVITDGDDGYFIDQLWIRKNGQLVAHHGRDDGNGWCLSTDANDANGGWKSNLARGCQPLQRFNAN